MMVVERFHHSTTGVPLQVGNHFQAIKRSSSCASRASSFNRCVGNGGISFVLRFSCLGVLIPAVRCGVVHSNIRIKGRTHMRIIGISALDKDSTVTLVEDGKIIAALSEERLTRVKQQAWFPFRSLEWI